MQFPTFLFYQLTVVIKHLKTENFLRYHRV